MGWHSSVPLQKEKSVCKNSLGGDLPEDHGVALPRYAVSLLFSLEGYGNQTMYITL